MIPALDPYGDERRHHGTGYDGPGGRDVDPPPERRRAVFGTLCSLLARTQVTRVRVLSVVALDLLAVASGIAYGHGVRVGAVAQPLVSGAAWVDELCLGFVVPVASLLFASSMFGDLADDKTLVYLWLRPVERRRITWAAALTSFLVTWPLVVPAVATTAACTGGGQDLVIGTALAATVEVAAYTGVFVALGARVKQPLVWGLLYVIIWEKYVALTSSISKALALRAYGASILEHFTRTKLVFAFLPWTVAIAVPLAIGWVGLAYTTRRLKNQDVA